MVEHFEILAIENYNAVADIFNKIPKLLPGSEFINHHSENSEDRTNWNLEDYRKKDPKALQDKTLFEQLLNNK